MKYYLRGGIGDLLQSLWFIKNNPDGLFIAHVHFQNAKKILESFGAKNVEVYNFCDWNSHNEQVDAIKNVHAKVDQSEIKETPRSYYSNLEFGFEFSEQVQNLINSFEEKKKIIGIHPFRSEFAISVYNEYNLPAKKLPVEITKNIIQEDYNYLIFGSKKELLEYGLSESKNVKFASFDNILTSLSCVKHCETLIGLDSCFKTASSMQKIKTICVIGDFDDPTRDQYFVNQYAKDGIMKVIKTKNIENQKEEIINFIKANL